MDIGINEVKDIIESLESNSELSIKEEKYLKVAKLCVQLAAENVALKAAIPDELFIDVMDENIDDISMAEDLGFNACVRKIARTIQETTATDRIVAGIKADGVEEFAALTEKVADEEEFYDNGESAESLKYTAKQARLFAKQLREGADK